MDSEALRRLHRKLLHAWNARDGDAMAALFTANGTLIGFDGSVVVGRDDIASHLRQIFTDHETATYVAAVRDTCAVEDTIGLLRADVGMVPPGADDLNPAVNAIQTVVAMETDGTGQVLLLQNTPAAFHGRPDAVEAFTDDLRKLLPAT